MTKQVVTFAKYEPAIALASLFRPVCRGKRPVLNVDYRFDGLRLRFVCHESPDVRDQSILLAAIGLAGLDSLPLDQSAAGSIGRQLWLDLEPTEQAIFDTATVVTCSYYQLLEAAGMDSASKRSYDQLKEILWRLSMIGCRAYKDGYDWSMKVLSYAARPDGRISIAMNSRFAAALAGQHVRISLEERRLLGGKQKGSEVAELLHCYLTASLRDGHNQRVYVDTLATKIYGNESKNPNTVRDRRSMMVAALRLIEGLKGWTVHFVGSGASTMVEIKRGQVIEQKTASPPAFVE